MIMSKSQAVEVARALRKAAQEGGDALVRVGYQPGRGIVVDMVKNGRTTLVVHETGATKLTSTFDTLTGYDQWEGQR